MSLEPNESKSNAGQNRKRIEGERVRTIILSSWMAASIIAIAVALWSIRHNPWSALLQSPVYWDGINITSLLFVFYTIISVFATHKVDKKRSGYGITHAYRTMSWNEAIKIDEAILSAIMTRQSIHIAIALGLLIVIIQNRLLDPGQNVSTLLDALKNFRTCIAWIVTGGLSLCVMLILVSALCHDYSCRFGWGGETKRDLLRKGLKLDNWSWYAFTFSLILSIALASPFLCILMNTGYGFLLLYYYFFSRDQVRKELQQKPGNPNLLKSD